MIDFFCVALKLFLKGLGFNLNLTILWVVIILTMVFVNLNNRYFVFSLNIYLKLNILTLQCNLFKRF